MLVWRLQKHNMKWAQIRDGKELGQYLDKVYGMLDFFSQGRRCHDIEIVTFVLFRRGQEGENKNETRSGKKISVSLFFWKEFQVVCDFPSAAVRKEVEAPFFTIAAGIQQSSKRWRMLFELSTGEASTSLEK